MQKHCLEKKQSKNNVLTTVSVLAVLTDVTCPVCLLSGPYSWALELEQ